jgi:hypothetical protein
MKETNMLRRMCTTLSALVLFGGCMKPPMDMGPPKKPAPAPEMKELEKLIGTWNYTWEIVSPSNEEMKKPMPPGSKEPQTSFKGTGKMEWAMGGTALKGEGTFDIEGQKMTYVEYWMWDGRAKKYRTLLMNDWGEIGEGWVTRCKDCDGFCSTGKATDAQGNKKRADGCMWFVDKDTHEWTFTEKGPMGKMTMKGTSKRQK